MKGWIKLHRSSQENWVYFADPFSRFHAWIDLLILANHKERMIDIRGNLITVKRGQLGWSMKSLAKRWGWSPNKVNRYLERLKNGNQIDYKKTAQTTIISIKNYEKYQANLEDGTQTERRRNADGTQTETNKNDKNDKKGMRARKKSFGEYVSLTPNEFSSLVNTYGKPSTDKAIEKLNNYKGSTGKKYKSDFRTIKNWVMDEVGGKEKGKLF